MCGIAGSINESDQGVVERMLDFLAHRGPDDSGVLCDETTRVILGHRRLSIIDLTSAGHQPMTNADDSVWVTFNGEIYNYKQLRYDLKAKGYVFRSSSDTEAIVHGYSAYGEDIFKKLDGMWALALYDKTRGKLFLSRDPAGMKPLYFRRDGAKFYFASEIGALTTNTNPAGAINQRALKRYLAHGYIYGGDTIYETARAIPPASTFAVTLRDGSLSEADRYTPLLHRAPASFSEALAEFERTFARSVEATLQADVPVGLFLSGGIDSALVGRSLQKQGAPLRSFTIGFEERAFDEAGEATRIARSLGFPHTAIPMRASDIANDIERIFDAFGEPFADTSALPTYYLSKYAHAEGYKVALTGDGADELFGGYPTHYVPTLARLYQTTPRSLDTILETTARALPESFTKLGSKEKLTRFLHGARHPHQSAHALWKRVFTDAELGRLVTNADTLERDASFDEEFSAAGTRDERDAAMRTDFMTFLTYDCLVKSDICAMQHGLELRMPFLNKALIEYALSIPVRYKVSPFRTKKLLRASLARDVPAGLTRLPKRGFVPPLAHWLTKELKGPMLSILSQREVAKAAFLDYTYIESLIEEHLSRRADRSKKLWCLMSLVRFCSRL